jgi:chaperonin GroES
MAIKATNNFVFIIRDKSETEKNGLFIPSKGVEKQHKGKIVSSGSLVKDLKIKNGVGKTAVFHKGIGFEIDFEDNTYLVLTDNEIIGII